MEDLRFSGETKYRIHNIGLVKVERNQNYTFRFKKGKEQVSFIFLHSGAIHYDFSGVSDAITVTGGMFCYIPKGLPYCATYLKNKTVITVITFDLDADPMPSYWHKPFINENSRISLIFQELNPVNSRSALCLSAKIFEILYILDSESFSLQGKYKGLLPGIEELQRHFAKNRKVADYAKLCAMSESNFRKLFREYFGMSVIEYRNRLRLAEVRKMVGSGEYTVSEAAYRMGFNNMSFFYRFSERVENESQKA